MTARIACVAVGVAVAMAPAAGCFDRLSPDPVFLREAGSDDASVDGMAQPDAARDATADAAIDAAIDAPVDAPVDAPIDAPIDALVDAPFDSGCGNTQTDPQNCGTCGHSCLAGSCSAGTCTPIVVGTGPAGATAVALDGATIFWSVGTANAVYSCPVTGCTGAPPAFVAGITSPQHLVVASSTLFVSAEGSAANLYNDGAIYSCATSGCAGAPTALATSQLRPLGMAVANGAIFWANRGGGGSIMKCSSLSTGCGASPVQLVFNRDLPQFVALDATNVFWTAGSTSSVNSALASDGSNAGPLATGLAGVLGLAIDANGLYVTVPGASEVAKVSFGGVTTPLATSQTQPGAIAVDATSAYFTTSTGIAKVPLAGGAVTQLATQSGAAGVAVDSSYVYWARADGAVLRVAK